MKTFASSLLFLIITLATIQPLLAAPLVSADFSAPTTDEAQLNKAIALDWSITTSRESSWQDTNIKETTTEHTSIVGSAYIAYHTTPSDPTPRDVQVDYFQLNGESNWQFVETGYCHRQNHRRWIKDPARYTGDNSLIREAWLLDKPNLWLLVPWKGDDGSWYIQDPFQRIPFSYLIFTYQDQSDSVSCAQSSQYRATFQAPLVPMISQFPTKLQGDAEGRVFHRDESLVSGDGTIIHYQATVRLLGDDCALHIPPVDAEDPLVKDVEVAFEADKQSIPPNRIGTLAPPDPVTLTLRVTCDGIPVKNAAAHIEVEVKGGGHYHNDSGYPRPHGYLNGIKLTEEEPSIQVQTDHRGLATITFLPGRDTLTDARGIAGTYLVTARLDDERFSNREVVRAIQVKRTDFVELFVGEEYEVVRGDSQQHPEGTWGQPITMDAIARLAEDFQAAQEQHNQALIALGEQPWPIVPLSINDISLQDGGLFDVVGFDVVRQIVTGQPWQPPHYAHLEGTTVDLNSFRGNPHREWLVATLRRLGERYGRWERRQPTLTLEIDDDFQVVAQAKSNPDPGVVAFFNRSSEIPTAAPGRVISYTIALDNINGGQDSSAVTLSTHLPPGLLFVSASPQPTGFSANQQPFWEVGVLPTKALPALVQVVAQLDTEIAPDSVLTVTVEAQTDGADANPNNNQDSFALFVQPPGADLVVDSDLDAVAMTVDQPITVSLNLANLGNLPAPDALLRLAIPSSVTVHGANPLPTTIKAGELSWNLGEVAVDAERTITLTLEFDPSLLAAVPSQYDQQAPEGLTYTLSASAAVPDIDLENNQEQIIAPITVGGSNIALWLASPGVETPGVLSPGQIVIYTLSYANFGNQMASATGITLSLGSALSLIEAEPAPKQTTSHAALPGVVATWEIGDLPVGATGVIQVQVAVDSVATESASLFAIAHTSTRELDFLDNLAVQHFTSTQPFIDPVTTNVFIPLVGR